MGEKLWVRPVRQRRGDEGDGDGAEPDDADERDAIQREESDWEFAVRPGGEPDGAAARRSDAVWIRCGEPAGVGDECGRDERDVCVRWRRKTCGKAVEQWAKSGVCVRRAGELGGGIRLAKSGNA